VLEYIKNWKKVRLEALIMVTTIFLISWDVYICLHSIIYQQTEINWCTVQPFTESDDTRCCVNTIFPPEDGHVNA